MAGSISIAKHREQIARAKRKASKPTEAVVRTGGMTLAGALIGYLESTGALPAGFMKNKAGQPMIPTKVAIALAAHGVAAMSKGAVHEVAAIVGDTAAANYGYAAGRAHALVAGD